ncbi:CBS domain-containing protein [Ferrimonas marina]|uniref:CBS domain-containing protein n=1 Tax=Ferrimonas marina TaxID=299255 RepID=A0A1M5SFX5_9GAMM|nr:CBS domain-containing protein [Ferrimonas marina]SHH37502.1 CBS domain-containing protein [Ferrimonas marina]
MTARTQVQQVMTQRWQGMDGLATVQEALDTLVASGAEAIIVNKRDDSDEFGLVLLSDIGKQVVARDRAPERVNLYEIMSKPVISVAPTMDVRYCARLFERFGINQAPVSWDGKILGLVSYRDLVLKSVT